MNNHVTEEQWNKMGVYLIRNTTNGKVYIGSTSEKFIKRYLHHYNSLKRGDHKNSYLQSSFNKNGEVSFEFIILEEVEDKSLVLEREQLWMNKFDITDKSKCYNINPLATGGNQFSLETIRKRNESIKKAYWDKVLNNPDFKGYNTKMGGNCFAKGTIPWNKGIKYESTDHLKVPKTFKSEEIKDTSYKLRGEMIRTTQSKVYVYTKDMVFLGEWRCSSDLEEWSLTSENKLPVDSRFKKPRMGKPLNFLNSCNINKCCNKIIPNYKGLIFSNLPLHQVTDERVLDKNGELCDENTVLNFEITKGLESV